jgi:hypothetical protein
MCTLRASPVGTILASLLIWSSFPAGPSPTPSPHHSFSFRRLLYPTPNRPHRSVQLSHWSHCKRTLGLTSGRILNRPLCRTPNQPCSSNRSDQRLLLVWHTPLVCRFFLKPSLASSREVLRREPHLFRQRLNVPPDLAFPVSDGLRPPPPSSGPPEDFERSRQPLPLLRREFHEGEATVVVDPAPVQTGPDDPTDKSAPPKGRRQIHVARKSLVQVVGMLDARPPGAEVQEAHPSKFEVGPPGEVPGNEDPCDPSAGWCLRCHGRSPLSAFFGSADEHPHRRQGFPGGLSAPPKRLYLTTPLWQAEQPSAR